MANSIENKYFSVAHLYKDEKDRIAKLQAQGIDAQLDLFEGCWHGFGLGIGTAAEGWIDNAVAFWQRHMTT